MIIKAIYYYNGNKSGEVKIDTDTQDINKVVQASAPKHWDVCRWDNNEILPEVVKKERKKRIVEEVIEPEIHDEITDETSE